MYAIRALAATTAYAVRCGRHRSASGRWCCAPTATARPPTGCTGGARLLDQRCLEAWLDLFAPDGLLWVPGRAGDVDPACHVSIIYDHLPQLRARVTRLLSGKEAAQDPPSRTVRALTNLCLVGDPEPGGEVAVESVQVLYETRGVGTSMLVLPARVTHRLRPIDGRPGWAIVSKRIDLLEVDRHFDNLAFLL